MISVRAGSFSASLSNDGQLYVWGQGLFGEFYTPHRIKSARSLDVLDFKIANGGTAALLTRSGKLYTWGPNDSGQLGLNDF
jgi:alpha-tubulin suppressor-like RCC1 family protein